MGSGLPGAVGRHATQAVEEDTKQRIDRAIIQLLLPVGLIVMDQDMKSMPAMCTFAQQVCMPICDMNMKEV